MHDWFSKTLIPWYKRHKRDLPWRHETDPYKIWLSEIILQQTQVSQGLSYYNAFTEAFPKVQDLAAASEDRVLKLWQGLGYYSRARNLHASAKMVTQNFGGQFPHSFEQLKSLKGVGDYTAAAIASFAFHLPHAVVDGNVYRFLSRLFAISTPIDTLLAKKQFTELANSLLDQKRPALFNQAIMEFGSQYCKPSKPNCTECVFQNRCLAFQNQKVEQFPVKSKKTKVKKRHFNFLVIADKKGHVLLEKRQQNDIWKGLYQFPLIETNKAVNTSELRREKLFKSLSDKDYSLITTRTKYTHQLSHQQLHARFWLLITKSLPKWKGTVKTNAKNIHTYAMPRLLEKFMDDGGLKEIF